MIVQGVQRKACADFFQHADSFSQRAGTEDQLTDAYKQEGPDDLQDAVEEMIPVNMKLLCQPNAQRQDQAAG